MQVCVVKVSDIAPEYLRTKPGLGEFAAALIHDIRDFAASPQPWRLPTSTRSLINKL
jgi:hypothetical protein